MKLHSKKEFEKHSSETRKTGGEKAPVSPTQISKLVCNIIPASVRPLENEFDECGESQHQTTSDHSTFPSEAAIEIQSRSQAMKL